MKRFNLFLCMILFSGLAFSNPVLRIIDGDTVVISAPYLPKPLKPELNLRLYGIDTPEKGHRAKCLNERTLSDKATAYTKSAILKSKKVEISIDSWDKYGGRVLGDVYVDGSSLSKLLIENGLARPYDGGKKTSWCQ